MGESAELKPLLPPPPDPILTVDDLPAPASVVAAKWQPPKDIRIESELHRAVEEALLVGEHSTPKVMPALESQTPTIAIPPLDGGTVSGSIEMANTEAVESKPEPIDALAETMERPRAPAIDATAATHDAIPEQHPEGTCSPGGSLERDRIALVRGQAPIAEPYVRDPEPRSRTWLYASLGVAVGCLLITVSVVMWARGEVARARAASAAQSHDLVAMRTVEEEPSDPEVAGVAVEATVVEASECSVRVAASVKAATVWIDGKSRGAAPTTVPVACGEPTTVEVRHPRYQDFKHTVTPQGALEIEARLEREKTKLTVWSEPSGAMVTYNGEVIGKTPLVTTVNRYEAGTLWFHHPQAASDWRKIVPKAGAKTVSIQLAPKS